MSGVKRICLFAGPGCGKSVAAAWLFVRLKISGFNVDLVQEKAKELVYDGVTIKKFDQLQLFAEQTKREELLLRNNVIVVTDSPPRLGLAYAVKYDFPCVEEMTRIADAFDRDHPALNIYLKRDSDAAYQQAGRYETHDEALAIDEVILELVKKAPGGHVVHAAYDLEGLGRLAVLALTNGDIARWQALARLSDALPIDF